ncbi:MAG TPA: sterol desaturase family protein [Candidatus Baltobacteraceae bacterium]|nr:sterol desaturase family protein [Candidatus Baltobacteraceae bacterium]
MIRTFFRHGSNGVLFVGLAVLAGVFAGQVVRFSAFGALVGALLFFSSEYTTHRFLFHAPPSAIAWVRKLQHRLHYDHHIDPPELELLFLPLWFVIPTALAYFGLYIAITRDLALALSLVFGSLLGLAYYEWVHYVAHVPFVPKTPFGRYIKKYHLWHHFKNEHLWFGVTNPSMDYAMFSYRDVETAERSTTVREVWRSSEP